MVIVTASYEGLPPNNARKFVSWTEGLTDQALSGVRYAVFGCGNVDWARTPIDAFVLSKLEQRGLAPSAAADRRTLIRRVTYDLTGLPPTPADVESFLNDSSVDDTPTGPFGGEKNSGIGRFGGEWIMREFTTEHWVTIQHAPRQYPF